SCRDDYRLALAWLSLHGQCLDRQSMAIRGGQGGLPAIQLDIDAGEHRPALVARRCNHGLLDRILELCLVDLDLAAVDAGRYRRKVGRVDAANVGIEAIAPDRQGLGLLVERHGEWLIRVSRDE